MWIWGVYSSSGKERFKSQEQPELLLVSPIIKSRWRERAFWKRQDDVCQDYDLVLQGQGPRRWARSTEVGSELSLKELWFSPAMSLSTASLWHAPVLIQWDVEGRGCARKGRCTKTINLFQWNTPAFINLNASILCELPFLSALFSLLY